jgi:hypothetical protein
MKRKTGMDFPMKKISPEGMNRWNRRKGDVMKKHRCHRCGNKEHIPTFQFVKFDNDVHYLCSNCWQVFRKWFFRGRKDMERTHFESAA